MQSCVFAFVLCMSFKKIEHVFLLLVITVAAKILSVAFFSQVGLISYSQTDPELLLLRYPAQD